jgi:hypothetical protein
MKLRLCGLLMAVMFVAGCSTTLEPRKVNADGRFPTGTKLSAEGVKIVKPFSENYKALAYIKTDSREKGSNDFFIKSFQNMGVFTQVVLQSDLERLVIERKLTDKIATISDLISLNRLEKEIGPFLIVETYIAWKSPHIYFAQLKAIDPESGATVLLLEQEAADLAGLDDPLFFPLLNGFLDWTKGELVSAGPTKNQQLK